MIRIRFDPTQLTGADRDWWDAWSKRAAAATQALRSDLKAGRPHKFRQAIWKDLKDWLLQRVFSGKCAYCETLVSPGFYGDAEHYRPKGRVTLQGRVIFINGPAHPGYYWLAYHWKNLIPSCERCNSEAKSTEFEVGNQYQVRDDLDPDQLDAIEDPLLLHPYGPHDPAQCLAFGDLGQVAAVNGDRRGQATIRICKLDREALNDARRGEQDMGYCKFLDLMHKNQASSFSTWICSRPYSAATRAYVVSKVRELIQVITAPANP